MSNILQTTPQQMPGDYSGSKAVPEVSVHEQARHLELVPLDHSVFPVPEVAQIEHRTIRGAIPLIGHETPEQRSHATAIAVRAKSVSHHIRSLRHEAAHNHTNGGQRAA